MAAHAAAMAAAATGAGVAALAKTDHYVAPPASDPASDPASELAASTDWEAAAAPSA